MLEIEYLVEAHACLQIQFPSRGKTPREVFFGENAELRYERDVFVFARAVRYGDDRIVRRGHRIEYLSVAEVAVGFEIGADEDLVAGLPYFARELCGYFRKYIDFFAVDVVAAEVGIGKHRYECILVSGPVGNGAPFRVVDVVTRAVCSDQAVLFRQGIDSHRIVVDLFVIAVAVHVGTGDCIFQRPEPPFVDVEGPIGIEDAADVAGAFSPPGHFIIGIRFHRIAAVDEV